MPPLRILVFAGALTFVLGAYAEYAVDWSTADSGGGTSSGSVYAVSGTAGQPDAGGAMTGGTYAVMGGFWVLPLAIQTDGAPTLFIERGEPGMAVISWTPASTNWVLQHTMNPATGVWSNAPSGWTNPVIVPATLPVTFYRLHDAHAAP